MTVPANTTQIPDGSPLAKPTYLVDASGNPITSSNPLNIGLAVDTLDAQVTNDGTFAKETGGNLATLAGAVSSSKYQVNVTNVNPNGQTTMSASGPVAIAVDQSAIPIKNQPTSAVLYSTTQTGVSSWAGSGDISIPSGYRELFVNMNITAITGTSIQLRLQRKDSFGAFITVNTGSTLTSTGTTATSWGAGMSINHSFGNDIQLIVVFNTISSVTFTLDLFAR